MKFQFVAAAGFLAAASPHVAEAAWRPLSEQAIDTATFAQWKAAVPDAKAIAEAARSDKTLPDVRAARSGFIQQRRILKRIRRRRVGAWR